MAKFDPEVQEQGQREYTNEYRPIEQPIADVSGLTRGEAKGRFFSDVGKLGGEEIKLADEIEKYSIENDVRSSRQPIVDEHLQQLAQLSAKIGGPNVMDEVNSNVVDHPDDVKNLSNRVDSLVAMKANGKGVDDTYFQMRMLKLATDMRRKYPGYEDYVDEQMWKASKIDPANGVVSNLESRIKEIEAAGKSEADKIRNHIFSGMSYADPGTFKMWQRGELSPDPRQNDLIMLNHIQEAQSRDRDNARLHTSLELQAAKGSLNKKDAEADISSNVAEMAHDAFNNFTIKTGLDQNERLVDLIDKLQKNPAAFDQEHTDALKVYAQQAKNQFMIQARAKYLPMAKYVDGDTAKINQMIQDTSAMFDNLAELPHGFSMQKLDAITHAGSDEAGQMLRDSRVRQYKALEMIGAEKNPLLQSELNATMEKVDKTGRTAAQKLRDVITQSATGERLMPDWEGSGYTLRDVLKDTTPLGPATTKKALDIVSDMVTKPGVSPEVRKNVMNTVYSDPNGLVPIKPDSVDAYGRVTPGKNTYFANLVNEQATANAKAVGPDFFRDKYIPFAVNSYGSIFQSEIQQLNTLQDEKVGFHLDESNNWVLNPGERERLNTIDTGFGRSKTDPNIGRAAAVERSFNRINTATWHMQSIWKDAGITEPQGFMARLLISSGLNPAALGNTVPAQMVKAIKGANPPPKPKEDKGGNL